MKMLIAFGLGLSVGYLLKNPKAQNQPKFMIVDDRESMSDYLCNSGGTKAFVRFFKNKSLIQ